MGSFEGWLEDELRTVITTHRPFGDNLRKNRTLARSALVRIVDLNPHVRALDGPQRWQRLLWAFLDTAASCAPNRTKAVRQDIRRARELSREIRELAAELARKLRARDAICNARNLSRNADSHPVDLLNEAACIADTHAAYRGANIAGSFRLHVAPALAELDQHVNPACWPTSADLIEALASLQDRDEQHEPMIDALHVATATREASVRDYWRALDVALREIQSRHDVNIDLPDQDCVDLTAAVLDSPAGCTLDNFRKVKATS